jgi:hypothetical protein
MRKPVITFFCAFLLLLASCTTEKPKLTVEFKNKKGDIEQKSGIFYINGDGRQLAVANYDLRSDKSYGDSENDVKTEDQVKVVIYMYELKGDENTPVEPSEYTFGDAENKSVANAQLYYFADGKQQQETLSGGGKTDGVKITARNGDTVTGEVNIRGKDNKSINGKFEAKVIKK